MIRPSPPPCLARRRADAT